MSWQEWVFSVGNVVFLTTLIPTMVHREAYVPRCTSVPIATMLCLYTLAFASLEMYVATVFSALTVGAWAQIAAVRGQKPHPKED